MTLRTLAVTALVALGGVAALAAVPSQPANANPQPGNASPQAAHPGWSATYLGGTTVVTVVPRASFALEAGETLHPALRARDWTADYRTELDLPSSGRYRFGIEVVGGRGSLRVGAPGAERDAALAAIDAPGAGDPSAFESGAVFTEWLDLGAEVVQLDVSFRALDPGALRLRTLWELERTPKHGFRAEPLPVRRVSAPAEGVALSRAGELDFHGRLRLEERGCTNCHLALGAAGMAVDRRAAPDLSAAGARLWSSWVERWLAAPHELLPGAGMPSLFGAGPDEAAARESLVHYLAAQRSADDAGSLEPGAVATEPAVLARGRALYHARGCIACHDALASPADVLQNELYDDDVFALPVVRPFGDLTGKWKPAPLAAYLLDPARVHPDGRMPSLSLDDEEADLIATYLVSLWGGGEDVEPEEVLVERGEVEYLARGCAACHGGLGGEQELTVPGPALTLLDATGGCLDPDDTATPRYDLDDEERELLGAGLYAARASRGVFAPLDEAERRIERLACRACHVLDDRGGVHPDLDLYFQSEDEKTDLGDEGRLPPRLDRPGTKLTTTWLEQVLRGEGVARPYLGVRMPVYGAARTNGLAARLAEREGLRAHSDVLEPEATDDDVLAGRELMGREAFACITCHVYKDYPPVGTPGPALTAFGERLRYEWFRAYMQDPQRYKPGSRMPTFGTGGVSTLADVLHGDLDAQSDAMWAYFGLGEFMPVPEGVELESAMKLVPEERVLVVRAFLDPAGSRAIAVGSPVGVHYSFDAEASRLVDVWQGDFVDAAGAWAGRGGSVLEGRGETLWEAPEVPVVAFEPSDDPGTLHYRGYRLAADGAPTFRYELRSTDGVVVSVEESIAVRAQPEVSLRRALRFTAPDSGGPVLLRVAGGGALLEPPPQAGEAPDVFELGTPGTVTTLTFEVRP